MFEPNKSASGVTRSLLTNHTNLKLLGARRGASCCHGVDVVTFGPKGNNRIMFNIPYDELERSESDDAIRLMMDSTQVIGRDEDWHMKNVVLMPDYFNRPQEYFDWAKSNSKMD